VRLDLHVTQIEIDFTDDLQQPLQVPGAMFGGILGQADDRLRKFLDTRANVIDTGECCDN